MKALLPAALVAAFAAGCSGDDGPNRPPVVSGQPVSTAEDTAVTASFNASDPDGDTLTFRYSTPAHGAVTPDGASFTYTPAANFHGTDTVTITAADGEVTATATITITVTPVNDAPVATDDALAGGEDTPTVAAASALVANDTDGDGDALTVTQVGAAQNGTVALAAGTITFTPAADFIGEAGFDYTLTDGTATATGHVSIAVSATNDPPVAADDTATTAEDATLVLPPAALTANDTDVEGQALSIQSVLVGAGGTVAVVGGDVVFTPAPDFHGAASFEYVVTDGAATDVGRVAVTVTPAPDPPVAVTDPRTTMEDTPLELAAASLAANDTDPDGDALAVTQVGAAVGGTVALAGGTITFTPAPNLTGTASFTYTVSDGARTDDGTVTIDVTPVPDPPVAGDDLYTVPEDVPRVLPGAGVLSNDVDVDGPALSITGIAATANGTATVAAGDITFTAAPNFTGTATVDYVVSDGTLTDVGRITITVTPVNDAPVANPQSVSTLEDQPVTITLTASDVDSPAVTFAAGAPSLGTLGTLAPAGPFAATVTYTPPPGVDGPISFLVTASDGDATSAPVAVAVTITNVPRCGDGVTDAGETCDDGCNAGMPGVCEPADDGDGCSSTCELPCGDGDVDPGEQCDDDNVAGFDGCSATCTFETLFFSEYVEGSGNNKLLELANPFTTPTSLTGCQLRLYSNGSPTPNQTLVLTQTIPAQDVLVFCNPGVAAAVMPQCDVVNDPVINWNGDDTIELSCNNTPIDVFGQIGFDPGLEWGAGVQSTQDNTLRRKCTVTAGDPAGTNVFDPAVQWDGFATDTFADIGAYGCP